MEPFARSICAFAIAAGAASAAAPNAIVIHDGAARNGITRYMTGACLEDVNHEVYGGIYSQMIFGESFQEPASDPLQGFTAYGGAWTASGGEASVAGNDGPKLMLENSACAICEAEVDVKLGSGAGPSGILLRVAQPRIGADRFYGYEIAVGPGLARIARHDRDYKPLQDFHIAAAAGQWVTLRARAAAGRISVFVDGDSVGSYFDAASLAKGSIGLRAWGDGTSSFRNFKVTLDGNPRNVAFAQGDGGVSGMWSAVRRGSAAGAYGMDARQPFKGTQGQKLAFTGGEGEVGIGNQGLNRQGMAFQAGRPYEGYVWVRAEGSVDLYAALESADGANVLAEAPLHASQGDWERLDFTVTPGAAAYPGRFVLKLKGPGAVTAGHAFLQPGEWGRYQDLPVRKDVAEALVAQKLTVLRYGGSMINDPAYRWKNMIGPRDRRPMTHGTWYPYSSNGWAVFEFLDFCEKAGILGIPDLNSFESPQDLADFVEYANGDASTPWGARRAADGHPAPYHLRYLEIGNEEKVDDAYAARFAAFAPAMWAKDSSLILVVGDFGYGDVISDPNAFTGSWSGIKSLSAHKRMLDQAKAAGREVWFDIHINTDAPPDPKNIPAVMSFSDQLGRISPGARYKLVCFELNTFSSHSLARALANANAINALERMGDRLAIVCSANCLQVDGQNDNGWDQGLVFMDPRGVWVQPPYYVTQMASAHYQPECVAAEAQGDPGDLLNLTAARSRAGDEVVLKVVNGSARAMAYRLAFDRFVPTGASLSITALAGEPNAVNTAANPNAVAPAVRTLSAAADTEYDFPAHSYTVLHFGGKSAGVRGARAVPTRRAGPGARTVDAKGAVAEGLPRLIRFDRP